MKAKDLAEAPVDTMLFMFYCDLELLIDKRGRSEQAIEGAIREQLNKYKAVCRLKPDLDPYMLEDFLEASVPDFWKVFCKVNYDNWIKKKQKNLTQRYLNNVKKLEKIADPGIRLAERIANFLDYQFQKDELKEIYQ